MFGETGGTVVLAGGTGGRYIITSVNSTTGVTNTPSTRITHITLSSATSGSRLQIFNGNGGALVILAQGTNSGTLEFDYGIIGHTFPAGAFALPDGNANLTAVICKADLE